MIKGSHHSQETKEKMSKSHKGFIFSLETRKKISNSNKGKKKTSEQKQKHSKDMKNLYALGKMIPPFKGKNVPNIVRNKISTKLKGRKLPKETRLKMKKTWNTDERIKYARLRRMHQKMPLHDSKIEKKIQNFLNILGIQFKPHYPIRDIKHPYSCDILIPKTKIVIECDGDYWHGNPLLYQTLNKIQQEQKERDIMRNKELKNSGYNVLRLWEMDINKMKLQDFKKILFMR